MYPALFSVSYFRRFIVVVSQRWKLSFALFEFTMGRTCKHLKKASREFSFNSISDPYNLLLLPWFPGFTSNWKGPR